MRKYSGMSAEDEIQPSDAERTAVTLPLRRIYLDRRAVAKWDEYPFTVPAISALAPIELRSQVLFFVGENGSGKSTLLEAIAIACGFGREGGTRNFNFSTQNEQPDEVNAGEAAIDQLADALVLSWRKRHRDGFFLRAESFYNVASYLDRTPGTLRSYGGKSLHARSHGESFLTLMLERFAPNGLFLLDEPEAAVSPARQLALLCRMHDLVTSGADTQFIIATHSPIILSYPGAQICAFSADGIRETTYRETDAYRITRRFLENPERGLEELLED
jgi:predicted ATPase